LTEMINPRKLLENNAEDVRMLVRYEEFVAALVAFREKFEDFPVSQVNSEDSLKTVIQEIDSIIKEQQLYVTESCTPDLAGTLDQLLRTSVAYGAMGKQSLAQRINRLKDRLTQRVRSINYVLAIVSISDPLTLGQTFIEERAELTVDAKAIFLLEKLYALRKLDQFWDTGLIFYLNQVALDWYDDSRNIVKLLERDGYVDVFPASMRTDAKITVDGKAYVERRLAASKASSDDEEQTSDSHPDFVNSNRVKELQNISHPNFDFTRLVQLCRELNDNYERGNYLSVAMVGRSIINHVPPLFGHQTFDQVVAQYGGRSFKSLMSQLNTSLRSIADSYLHLPIRKTETLPNATQVNFSHNMDVLLEEVVRISK